jgi:hypothetical protein
MEIKSIKTELLQNAVVIFANIIDHDSIEKDWSYFDESRITGFNGTQRCKKIFTGIFDG